MNRITIKLSKLVLALVIFASAFLMGGIADAQVIEASTITSTSPTGYHHTGTAYGPGGQMAWFTNQSIEAIQADGNVVFCVQPFSLITDTQNYTPNAYDNAVLSKIVYHGYWNTGRTNWDNAITQLMVWEALGYTPTNDVPNYEARKAEINNAVAGHDTMPSFANSTITMNKNELIELPDTNNIIGQMALTLNNTNIASSINGNNLILHANTSDSTNGAFVFQKIKDLTIIGASIMYTHPSSQDVTLFRLMDPGAFSLNIRMVNGNVQIMKTGKVFSTIAKTKDENGIERNLPQYEEVGLPSSEFTIKAKGNYTNHSGAVIKADGEVVEVITSGMDGVARSIDLGEGNFTIEETKAPVGYNIDPTIHEFTVAADGGLTQLKQLDVVNQRKVQFFAINKTLEENEIEGLHNADAYKDVEFTIYANEIIHNYNSTLEIEKDTPITTFNIDEDGNTIQRTIDPITNEELETPFDVQLPDGKYYVKETKTNDSYVLDETEYEFEVNSDTDEQDIQLQINDGEEIINKLKDYKVVVNKTDRATGEVIKSKDFKFEAKLYDAKGELAETVVANADQATGTASFAIKGQISKVEIREIEAPVGYELSNEVKTFAIDNESEEALFDENLVYSFAYMNDAFPDDQVALSTGDDTSATTYLAYLGMALLAVGGVIALRLRSKQTHEA